MRRFFSSLFRMSCGLERSSLHTKARRAFPHDASPSLSLSASLYAASGTTFLSRVYGIPQIWSLCPREDSINIVLRLSNAFLSRRIQVENHEADSSCIPRLSFKHILAVEFVFSRFVYADAAIVLVMRLATSVPLSGTPPSTRALAMNLRVDVC